MIAYTVRRLFVAVPIVFLATLIVFLLVSARGDPLADERRRVGVSEQAIEARERQYHLDRSKPVQYGLWVRDFATGDWGRSFESGRSVRTMIADAAGNTAILVGAAAAVSIVVALTAGTFAAVRRGRFGDHAVNGASAFGIAMPEFWFALLLQLVLVVWLERWSGLDLFDTRGMYSPGREGDLVDLVRHLVLPALALTVTNVAIWTRVHRDRMIDALGGEHLDTARAAGVPERRIIGRHAVRSSLGPFVTVVAVDVGLLLGGVVVVERIFAWPGLGWVFINALDDHDYPVLLAWMTVAAVFVVVANVVGDLVSAMLDPRVRLG